MAGIEPASKKNSMKWSTSVDCLFPPAGGSQKGRVKQTKSNLPTILSLEWYGDGNHTFS